MLHLFSLRLTCSNMLPALCAPYYAGAPQNPAKPNRQSDGEKWSCYIRWHEKCSPRVFQAGKLPVTCIHRLGLLVIDSYVINETDWTLDNGTIGTMIAINPKKNNRQATTTVTNQLTFSYRIKTGYKYMSSIFICKSKAENTCFQT